MLAVPSGQTMVMLTLLPDCLKSVILHFSLPRLCIAFLASPFSVQTCCFCAPMPAGMPGMFICEVISQSSSLPALHADAANASAAPNANILCTFSSLVEPHANYDLGSPDAGCPGSRRPGLRWQRW